MNGEIPGFAGIRVVMDPDCPKDTMYFLRPGQVLIVPTARPTRRQRLMRWLRKLWRRV